MMTANNGETTGHYPTTTVNGEPYDPSGNETILDLVSARTVSYTHLTLPTIYSV